MREGPQVSHTPFGRTADGRAVEMGTLRNRHGLEMRVISYGAVIVSLRAPDRAGRFDDVVLGYDDVTPYLTNESFVGGVVGRYANRIAQGRFALDGKTYSLACNNGRHHLHGGTRGWHHALWTMESFEAADQAGVTLRHTSADGDEGYPGRVTASVTYTIDDGDQVALDYEAGTDAPTIVNLSQHSYFNLAGGRAPTILDHELTLAADRYTPVDERLIPTGELAPVAGTPFDFRQATRIGARIDSDHVQLRRGRGYDHNWVLNGNGEGLGFAARLADPQSGRVLEIWTTEPGLQFYSGNCLDGTSLGKGARIHGHRAGLCLETQHFPDSPNEPAFPSTVLRPGVPYRSKTLWSFSAG